MIASYLLCGVAHSSLCVQWQFLNLRELQRLYETVTKNTTKYYKLLIYLRQLQDLP